MAKGKNVLTTGEVAKICNVAPRTVSKWFDSGKLRGYRIPGSKDRRIPVNELIRFMKLHDMPTAGLATGKTRVLIVDSNQEGASNLAEELREKGQYEVNVVASNFETGAVAHKFTPHVLIVNLLDKEIDAKEICHAVRGDDELQTIKLIAIANNLSHSESAALVQKGFDGYVTETDDATEVVRKIEEMTAIVY